MRARPCPPRTGRPGAPGTAPAPRRASDKAAGPRSSASASAISLTTDVAYARQILPFLGRYAKYSAAPAPRHTKGISMKISFSTLELPQRGVVVVGVMEDRELTPSGRLLDERLEGVIRRAIDASRFRGK